MRTTARFVIFFAVTLVIVLSCKKTTRESDSSQTKTPTIKRGETFQYNFGLIGIEDGMAITQQAKHFEVSTLNRDSTGKLIYTYQPSADYVGKDTVEITYYRSIGGPPVDSTKTILLITITP